MAETGQAEITKAVPAARWKAKKEGIDLSLVKGSGPHGVVLPRDLEQAQVTQGAIEASLKERRFHASTLARKLAEREGVALESVEGSGTRGRVMMADVETGSRKWTPRNKRNWQREGPLWKDDPHDSDQEGHCKADGPERFHRTPYLLLLRMWRWIG